MSSDVSGQEAVANSISFAIEGEVTLDTLSESMEALKRLLRELSTELVPESNIRWIVENLSGGSLHTTFRGSATDSSKMEDVATVARRYADIGEAVASSEELPCAADVVEAVEELLAVAQAGGTEAIFQADGKTARVNLAAWNRRLATGRSRAIGSVTGVIKGINGSGQPYINVYEDDRGPAVRCYVNDEQLKWALSVWGETVYVHGRLARDRLTRQKREIRQIIRYRVVQKQENARFENAFGAGQWRSGDPLPADLIRAVRDADSGAA